MNVKVRLPNELQKNLIFKKAKEKRLEHPEITIDESLILSAWEMAWDNCLFFMNLNNK